MPKKRKGKAAQAENASRARNARLLAMELASHPNPTCPNTPSESCLDAAAHPDIQVASEFCPNTAHHPDALLDISFPDALPDVPLPHVRQTTQEPGPDPGNENHRSLTKQTMSPDEAVLHRFMEVLHSAQKCAAEAEKKRRHNPGDSRWTKWRQKRASHALRSQGYPTIEDLFQQQQKSAQAEDLQPERGESGDEPESAVEETEITSIKEDEESDDNDDNNGAVDEIDEDTIADEEEAELELLEGLRVDANGARAQTAIAALLAKRKQVMYHSPKDSVTCIQNILKDVTRMRQAKAELTAKSKDKTLDVFLRSRILAMLGALNLWMDPQFLCTWKEASLIIAQAQGSGTSNHARNIRQWTLTFLHTGQLPHHNLEAPSSILLHEDIAQELHLHVTEAAKNTDFCAEALVNIVASDHIQAIFREKGIIKPSISVRTAQRWLSAMSWQYGRSKKGMYIDGHEREDVVAYREAFVARWKEYEERFHHYDNDGNHFPISHTHGQSQLILITHDESIFYQNDERHSRWAPKHVRDPPKPKGNGQSIMVSDFMTIEWGRLKDEIRCVIFCSAQI
jgi:hypothetical protein